jgi:hypothetical protein
MIASFESQRRPQAAACHGGACFQSVVSNFSIYASSDRSTPAPSAGTGHDIWDWNIRIHAELLEPLDNIAGVPPAEQFDYRN